MCTSVTATPMGHAEHTLELVRSAPCRRDLPPLCLIDYAEGAMRTARIARR